MILYVNGDSHSAGAEAVNEHCFAQDEYKYRKLGRRPHPDNNKVCFGNIIAKELGATFYNGSESASSNSRIIRTTKDYLEHNTPDLVVIGWSTWEREEWLYENQYWQVNAAGVGLDWPRYIKDKYRQYIANLDWSAAESKAHNDIFLFHRQLNELNIPHLFFNSYCYFNTPNKVDWQNNYIDPYNPDMTYYNFLTKNGYKSKPSYHFGADGHAKWADFLLPYLTKLL